MRRRVRVGEATMATTSEETRKELVCAAQEELIQGQGHLEMQAVARRVQVSVGLAYHHFGSKAGLIADVVEEFYSRLDAAAFSGAKLLSKTWAERLQAVSTLRRSVISHDPSWTSRYRRVVRLPRNSGHPRSFRIDAIGDIQTI
jgi:AcrR family transcriptional regulator